jgi:type I restriction enzyme M protein
LFGQEASRSLSAIARMNLFIHEQDDAILLLGECLRAPQLLQGKQLQQFDAVLANPPQRLDPWLLGRADQDAYGRFWRGAPPKSRADYAYISHCLAMTRVGRGRLAIIVPQGILFRGGAEGRIRQQLLIENSLDVVISLPPNVLPHTTLPMAVCLFDRSREAGGARAHVRDVLLIDASMGVAPNKNLSLLSASQVDQIIAEVNQRQSQGQRCYLAGIDEIAANDYDLNLPRYLFDREKNAKRNLPEELQEIGELEKQLLDLRNQMMQQLKALPA